jgi:hypothetical protein
MPDPTTPNPQDSAILQKYYELRQYLGIELNDLEDAYLKTPRIVEEAGYLAAEANRNENDAKHMLEVVTAEAADRLRAVPVNGKPPSQAYIESVLPADPEVRRARDYHDQTRFEAAVCVSLFRAFETQSRLLTKASDMVLSGWFAPGAALDPARREIRQATLRTQKPAAPAGADTREARIGRPVS